MTTKTTNILAILLLMASLTLKADTVSVTFEGTTGVNDGTSYVLPYDLSVNGQNLLADCYDFFDTITVGESWTASEDTLAQAVASGKFSGQPDALFSYELVSVLSTLPTPTAQSQIDLQHEIWNTFDPGWFFIDPEMASDNAIATAEIPTFNFNRITYIEPVPGENVQAFLTWNTPEPATLTLIGIGLLGLGLLRRGRA